jgi:hypothetical protein
MGVRPGAPLGPDGARLGRVLPAIPGTLGEKPHDERHDGVGRVDHRTKLGRRIERVHPQELFGVARERSLAGQEPVEDAPERVEVRRARDVVHLVLDLLGSHVARRAGARMGRKFHGFRAAEALVVGVESEPGQAEIEHVDVGRLVLSALDEHVRRLQIAVDDAASVCV